MDRDEFAGRFARSAAAARELARPVVIERLPERLVFRLRIDAPWDEPGGRAVTLHRCDAQTAVGELWRGGRVPHVVGVGVVGETGDATVVEVTGTGRFTDDEDLFLRDAGREPPFTVHAPPRPFGTDSTPFSIHTISECWDRADVRRLAVVGGAVRALRVMTGDGETPDLPDLPNLEILEHHAGGGVPAALRRFPRLRVLHVAAPDGFRVDGGPLEALRELTLTNLPPRPWGQRELAAAAPDVSTMDLRAEGPLWLDGPFAPPVRALSLTAATVAGRAPLEARPERLGLHLAGGTDRDVERLLESMTGLMRLSLRGTPVTDAIIPVLERLDLVVVDLVGTAVTPPALTRFSARHLAVGVLPRPGSGAGLPRTPAS
ncbi:hypothetical protein OHA72_59320 [Dactylosporangium sp. NBC_01737]|uniref:hypothetical protein n=1 Tax=Dactylosporangium sp. NBC_01737 TaxID=2975959 RepID=UPI002E0E8924|nr:hypothetical protein OHA72_59320 [Dactylosporangium sp. NBC_01737]